MLPEHGLLSLDDGPIGDHAGAIPTPPQIRDNSGVHLWAVRLTDVCHALEACEFGRTLETPVIKHTNLTGGSLAASAGELIFLDDETIVVNGCSGRYGPRTAAEMEAVALAFRRSGYRIWSMGFDVEANRPFPFVGVTAAWVP